MAAPANDNLANAIDLVADTTQVTGDTTEATAEVGELKGTGSSTTTESAAGGRTVWYRWKARSTGTGRVHSLSGSAFDTYLTIFKANGVADPVTNHADLQVVASDDDAGDGATSAVALTTVAGTIYYIQIAGYTSGVFGAYTYTYPPPFGSTTGNDDVVGATVLVSGTTQVTGDSTGATAEADEVTGDGSNTTTTTKSAATYSTLWFRWIAPSTTNATFTTVGSVMDTYLSVFKGEVGAPDPVTSVTDLEFMAGNDDGGGGTASSITITPVAGVSYYLQVRAFNTGGGAFTLNYPSPAAAGASASAGVAAVAADAYGAAPQVSASAGSAAVAVAAQNPAASVAVLPGAAVVDVAGQNAPVTAASTASAGVADVAVSASNATVATAVTVIAGVAEVAAAGQNAGGAVPHLFTTQIPTGADNSDGTPGITTATTVRFSQDGYINAVRFYATATISGTYTGAVWQVTGNDDPGPGAGTLLASKVRPLAPTAGTWNLIVLDIPVAVTAGAMYRVGVHSSAGRYVNTPSFFSADVINGVITADADGDDPVGLGVLRQGTFKVDALLGFPASTFAQSNYFVDVDYSLTTTASATADAGVAAVDSAGFGATVTAASNAAAGVAAVTVDGHGATTAQAVNAASGVAAVAVDALGASLAVAPSAGTADVTAAGFNPTVTAASNAAATVALAVVDAYGPSVSTASSVSASADVAQVAVSVENATPAVTVNAGHAAVGVDGLAATAATVAAGVGNAGTAEVASDAYAATAAPVLVVSAGAAAAAVSAATPTVVTEASATADAGVADVGVAAHGPQITVAVTVPAGTADVATEAFAASVATAASADAVALTAEATAQAFSALVAVLAQAGTADVGVDAYSVPRQRVPGRFTAGASRSRLTAGTLRRATYTTGSL